MLRTTKSWRKLILVGMVLASQQGFAAHASQDSRPQLTRQNATRTLLASPRPWLQEDFPSPLKKPSACGAENSRRVCDPDGVLSATSRQALEDYLQNPKYIELSKACETHGEAHAEKEMEKFELQVGVAMVEKMDLTPFGGKEENAAETFARYVHDSWGVGVETECGGTGALLFVSIKDRTIYVSRGAALERVLTDRRLDAVMDTMKEPMRSGDYDEAILQALKDIERYVESGPPALWERFIDLFFFGLIFIYFLGATVRRMWVNSRMQREYARVKSQLNEIDRARAEALAGKFRCTSCPICLEDFQQPTDDGGLVTTGSDGQPIKLLRCGHCMDEGCWADWVSNGSGTITKCPICMADIGNDDNNSAPQQAPQRAPANNAIEDIDRNADDNNDQDRIVRQYRRERAFRLNRLAARYPQYIRHDQIDRWTNPNYDGALVRDPSFVQSNPALTNPSATVKPDYDSGGFGGSASAGGRGGKW